ncbi:MAG: flagellar biosynthetic protein FliO [Deltaproteobacteria bacterium]|nr:flagellar biosynthetic protein FliO [Deltaproteobacteria bacterium]
MAWAAIKMLLALGIVLGLLFFLLRLLKQTSWGRKERAGDFSIRVLTTQMIAPRKYISLVEIGEEVLALGISEAQINVLTKIEHPELLQKIGHPGPTGSGAPRPSWLNHLPLKMEALIRRLKSGHHGK